jgi:hypothetical protein
MFGIQHRLIRFGLGHSFLRRAAASLWSRVGARNAGQGKLRILYVDTLGAENARTNTTGIRNAYARAFSAPSVST